MMRNNNLTKNKRVPTPARGTGLNDISHLSRSDFRKGFPFDILCSPASNKSQWNQQKSYSFVSGGGGGWISPKLAPKKHKLLLNAHLPSPKQKSTAIPFTITNPPKPHIFAPENRPTLPPPKKERIVLPTWGWVCENHPTKTTAAASANRPFPRRCELSPYFCPAPLATNAKLVELDTEFRRDDVRETWWKMLDTPIQGGPKNTSYKVITPLIGACSPS